MRLSTASVYAFKQIYRKVRYNLQVNRYLSDIHKLSTYPQRKYCAKIYNVPALCYTMSR